MAAATVDSAVPVLTGSWGELYAVQLSSLTSDQLENVAIPQPRPDSVSATFVLPLVTAGATDGSMVTAEWIKASDVAASETVAVKARVAVGGDITGAKLTVLIFLGTRASGGLTPP